jgi:WD40 repeat protein
VALAPGTHLGPYEVVEPLGAGGMGEVYRARDPRLSREVAIKLISTDGQSSPDRLRRFETEARAAAQLSHPNIVTVHDVGTHEGIPYLVLELLEGETLREALRGGLPPLRQAVAWALEAARGLGAAHERGIVHRDLKPDNIFLTRDGRLKILDFGLAKLHEPLVSSDADRESPTATKDTSPGVVLGTIGYMSPEQVKGETPDPRTDVFALGAVLYEMASGRKAFGGGTSAEILAAILRDEPPSLMSLQPGVPATLEAVVRRCLAKRPGQRFSSAKEVEAALETVLASLAPGAPTTRTGGGTGEPRGPYPGLASFTEAEAARFFGREREVEAQWVTLRQRRLAGLIGPSGAGKTSFVRAGIVASRPSGWGAIVATPGGTPLRALAQALVGELPSDPDTMRDLLAFDDPDVAVAVVRQWRKTHLEALVVLDQFEELFTLNPPEVQQRFAALLGRLMSECDVHVLLSMRDDFLIRCDEQEALRPVFQALSPLSPLSAGGLRRALVEPAKSEGFAFEDEALVKEMLESVEGARGALPLLAFAVARLWEKRDTETKRLTRRAYEEIGGVAGALAQHAEQTLERIGTAREPIVRELFRNLVTAQWTRAVVDRGELLSVVPDREAAAQVLDALVDARLLTSYESTEPDLSSRGVSPQSGDEGSGAVAGRKKQKVEIVHESLLRAWPRLVRWQAQDEEGAVLRDQLKQAAHLWEEKGRPDDLLWTGTSEHEFEVWRDRYPGKLTALEDDFARAMVGRARRRKQARRLAVAAAFVLLAAIATVMTISRQQVARSRDQAEAEARRAEGSKLLALAQARLEDDPTEALALTTASLELSDTDEARLFAVRALQAGPPVTEVASEIQLAMIPLFSPDGTRLIVGSGSGTLELRFADGAQAVPLPGHGSQMPPTTGEWGDGNLLVTGRCCGGAERAHVWSPAGERLGTIELGRPTEWHVEGRSLYTVTDESESGHAQTRMRLRSWTLPDGDPREHGHLDLASLGGEHLLFAPGGRGLLYAKGREIRRRPLPGERGADRLVGTHAAEVVWLRTVPGHPEEGVSLDRSGEIRVWSSSDEGAELRRVISRPKTAPESLEPDPGGRWVIRQPFDQTEIRVWDLEGLPGARPLRLRRSGSWYSVFAAFHPRGHWLVATTHNQARLTFWPLDRALPSVVEGYAAIQRPLAFSPDGAWLASAWSDASIRLWPLPGTGSREVRTLGIPGGRLWNGMVFDPGGRYLFVVGGDDLACVAPLDGSPARRLPVFDTRTFLQAADVSPSGRLVATAFLFGEGQKTLRVWDVETEELRILDLPCSSPPQEGGEAPSPTGFECSVTSLRFADETTLYTAGDGGLRRWDLESGTHELVAAAETGDRTSIRASWFFDRQTAVIARVSPDQPGLGRDLHRLDLQTGEETPLPPAKAPVLGPGSIAVARGRDGALRVGHLGEEQRHLLLGHEGVVTNLAVSSDGQWIASAGDDDTLRLWPMPDLSKPPLHTLPRDELLAKLKSLTNIRAVRDPDSPERWTFELDPFPGWRDVPTW